jgi:cell division transport system permease protein
MQLVGARHYLIRRPFLLKGITQGIIGACIAILLLIATLFLVDKQLQGLFSFQDYRILGIIFTVMLISGVVLAWISTWLSVNKYLNMKTDNLYT